MSRFLVIKPPMYAIFRLAEGIEPELAKWGWVKVGVFNIAS
jgi:hypothetical protein